MAASEEERRRRLQAALRENLRRRKAQARGREAEAGDDPGPEDAANPDPGLTVPSSDADGR